MELSPVEQSLLAEIQGGLPLTSKPYEAIGQKIGLSEDKVLQMIAQLHEKGIIRRMGLVVKHRSLGYTSNAMVVWNIPDEWETRVGETFSQFDFVTLCYSRPRRPPLWPYNLFCMIHGKNQATVLSQVTKLRQSCLLSEIEFDVLFSQRCFKQRGARYFKKG